MKKLVIILVICCFFVLGCGKKKETSQVPLISDISIIDIAAYDKLKEENKGKLVIINFFASWCPPCKLETPDFVSVYNDYKDKNFVIVGISIDDNKHDAIDFVNEFGVTYPVYIADPTLRKKFGVSKVPTNFVYSNDGELANIIEGMISGSMLRRMAELAAGEVD